MPLADGFPGGICAVCFGGGVFAEQPEDLPFTHIGDYALLEEIGRGGMGLVYRARQVSLNRPAAVKLILAGPLASPVERQRFLAEASAAAALEHPGIVAVYEAGDEDGQPYFAMQLIEGESLSAWLCRTPHFPSREAAELIRATALAVQHAHERGFLHRDLKPGNILLDAHGAPHVADFGLARRMDDDSHLTLTGAAVGTPRYMAPEQTDTRHPPTTAVDIYSLGAILYELLAGHPPFTADSLPDLFAAIREAEPASISAIRSEVDRDLDIICRKCLAKEPARRYRSAQQLADDLQRWLRGEPITARAAGKTERLWRWCRRRPVDAALAASVAVLLVGGLSGVVWQWRRANRAASRATQALQQAQSSLWQAYFNEARARRISRERGQRTGSLAAIARAAALHPAPELRNEAIAALALPDLGEPVLLAGIPAAVRELHADPALRNFGWIEGGRLRLLLAGVPEIISGLEPGRVRSWTAAPDYSRVCVAGNAGEDGLCSAVLWTLPAVSRAAAFEKVAPGIAFVGVGRRLVLWRDGNLDVYECGEHRIHASAPCRLRPDLMVPSPDESRVAVVEGIRGEIWSLEPLARQQPLPELPDRLTSLVWQPDGQSLVVGTAEKAHEAWAVLPALQQLRVLARHEREGVVACVHPAGLFTASTAWDGVIQFTHPALPDPMLRTTGLRLHQFSGDGRSLLVSTNGRAAICPVTAPDVFRCLPLHGEKLLRARALRLSPDGRWLATVSQESLVLWRTETLRPSGPLRLQDGRDLAFTGSDSLLVLDDGRGIVPVTLVPARDGGLTLTASAPRALDPAGSNLALSPDGHRVFTAKNECAVQAAATGETLFRWKAGALTANGTWSPDGRWLAAGYWNNLTSSGAEAAVWSAADGSLAQTFPAGNCAVFFTPDGTRLLVSATHECVEYETGTWRALRRHAREGSGLDHGAVAFAPAAGLMALMADESTIRLLDLQSGEEHARLTPPFPQKIGTSGLAFSDNGRWLACTTAGSLHIWDVHLLRSSLRRMGLDWD